MVERANFFREFNYGNADPKFVLTALAYIYEHVGLARVCEDAILRGSLLYPELDALLNLASNNISNGPFIANSIRDHLSGKQPECESHSVEGMFDEDN